MNKTYPFDSRLSHRAIGSAALTATATLQTNDQRVAMRTAFVTLVGLEAVKITANNELYKVVVEVSNDNFSTVGGVAAVYDFGATEVRQSGAPDSVAGDTAEIIWTTEVGGQAFQYWRVRVIISGTSPSITLYAHSSVIGDI